MSVFVGCMRCGERFNFDPTQPKSVEHRNFEAAHRMHGALLMGQDDTPTPAHESPDQ